MIKRAEVGMTFVNGLGTEFLVEEIKESKSDGCLLVCLNKSTNEVELFTGEGSYYCNGLRSNFDLT